MIELRYTLVADGTSDVALLRILTWLLREAGVKIAIQSKFADFSRLVIRPSTLSERMLRAVDLYNCDLLFVHRDSEREPAESRFTEIRTAEQTARSIRELPPIVGVVPVRMTEAFMLFNESAIRYAAGNPNGSVELNLPRVADCEKISDPKAQLYEKLRIASELTGRKLKKFSESDGARRVLNDIDDFSPLRVLSSFQTLESDIRKVMVYMGRRISECD